MGADFEDMTMDTVPVPGDSPHAGRNLIDLRLPARVGVQVAGIRREKEEILNPPGKETIEGGDLLLVVGSPANVAQLKLFLKVSDAPDSPEPTT
jgi:TrkA domain protein